MLRMTPRRWPIMPGKTRLEQRNTLFNVASTSRSHVASSMRTRLSPSHKAALLTSTSTPPNTSSAAVTMASTSEETLTSVCVNMALPPAALIPSATCSARAPIRSATTMEAPSAAKRRLMTRPIPDPPPVTMILRSANRISPSQ